MRKKVVSRTDSVSVAPIFTGPLAAARHCGVLGSQGGSCAGSRRLHGCAGSVIAVAGRVLILLRLLGLGHEVLHRAQDNKNEQQGNQHPLVCARFILRIAIFSQWLISISLSLRSKRLCDYSFLAKQSALCQAARRQQALFLLLARDHSPRVRMGCSEESATGPAPIHEAAHVWPQPLRCIPNN